MKTNKPDLTLSMDDKIYLAVSKSETEKLAFVYTLACLKADEKSTNVSLLPTSEIHAFRDKDAAKLYYETIEQIIDFNTNDEGRNVFLETNRDLIERFLANGR